MPQNNMHAIHTVIGCTISNLFPMGLLLNQKLYIGFIKAKFTALSFNLGHQKFAVRYMYTPCLWFWGSIFAIYTSFLWFIYNKEPPLFCICPSTSPKLNVLTATAVNAGDIYPTQLSFIEKLCSGQNKCGSQNYNHL